jgi:NADPH-dependent 2,4-dienoyl-CoA reductase/sulfur reductase-like enzyme
VKLDCAPPISFDFLVLVTGTKLTPPGSLDSDTKDEGRRYFRDHEERLKNAKDVVIIGGGAVGVRTFILSCFGFPSPAH